jgi:putative Mg2+ transporter-C (MgtC) family protein
MLELTKRVLITVLLCGFIGWERERRNKFAGLRTHILVGVGSALIVLTSYYIFDIYKSQVPIDPTRIISNIVTGVGFLCAGTIIRGGGSGTSQVIGLTTAATLWISSGIGMAVGAGFYEGATLVTVVVFLVLIGVRSIEGKIHDPNNQIK